MFDHLGIFVSDPTKSIPFYEACLAPLHISIHQRMPEIGAVIFWGESTYPFLWVGPATGEYYGTEMGVEQRRPMHIAFKAPSVESINEFHQVGLKNGGQDNGQPEDCGGGYFAAYLLDPDGNNIEAGIRIKQTK